jgi:hypothetical protein
MQETCGKCLNGVVQRASSWDVCDCRKRGQYVVGMLCTVCGDTHHYSAKRAEYVNATLSGTPGCSECDEPVEFLCVDVDDVQKAERRSTFPG